jgi:hypothetical protein
MNRPRLLIAVAITLVAGILTEQKRWLIDVVQLNVEVSYKLY